MKNIDAVYILGAGASKSDGAPMQNQLFQEFFKLEEEMDWISTGDFSDQIALVKQYFFDFFGIRKEKNGSAIYPTFEEALGLVDNAIAKNESYKNWSKDKLYKIRNSLIFVIAKTLDEKLKNSHANHKELIRKLKKFNLIQTTGFISLNYDIIIDNVLLELSPDLLINYGVYFKNFDRDNDFIPPTPNAIPLFKIHGSMNWLFCPTCNQIERTSSKATTAFYKAEPCDDCRTPMEPIIIPPTFYKDMSNVYIKDIFLQAELMLRNCKRIYICGYSFPDADLHFKYLLKKSELFDLNNKKIIVVDPDTSDTFKQKYTRFFKTKNNLEFKPQKFEDFIRTNTFA